MPEFFQRWLMDKRDEVSTATSALFGCSRCNFFTGCLNTNLALVALPIALLGLLITIYHSRLFARLGTNINTFKSPEKLVQTGLFKFTRNPMYLGFSLSLIGLALSFNSVIAWIVATAFIVISDRWYIRFEETLMHNTFGEAYERYCATTPRWISIKKQFTK